MVHVALRLLAGAIRMMRQPAGLVAWFGRSRHEVTTESAIGLSLAVTIEL